jgi:hypothetical protein
VDALNIVAEGAVVFDVVVFDDVRVKSVRYALGLAKEVEGWIMCTVYEVSVIAAVSQQWTWGL